MRIADGATLRTHPTDTRALGPCRLRMPPQTGSQWAISLDYKLTRSETPGGQAAPWKLARLARRATLTA